MRCKICELVITHPNLNAKETKLCRTCLLITEKYWILGGKLKVIV